MSDGADLTDLYRHAVSFVDKILKGSPARALGLTIHASLLLRADGVVHWCGPPPSPPPGT